MAPNLEVLHGAAAPTCGKVLWDRRKMSCLSARLCLHQPLKFHSTTLSHSFFLEGRCFPMGTL